MTLKKLPGSLRSIKEKAPLLIARISAASVHWPMRRPSGKPVSVELIQSSGSKILDREAVRIPLKVAAYPAPPGGTNTTVSVPINWRIS